MAYLALVRVPGNVFLAGTVAQVTTARLALALQRPEAGLAINGTVVNDESGKLGDLFEGEPTTAVNDVLRRQVKQLFERLPGGDPQTKMRFVARALVGHAKRAGVTRAQLLTAMGNIWDNFGQND